MQSIIWHCTRDGDYSMYTGAAAEENYLRGVQVSDAAGQVSFTTIFPACYSGRWPHIHFEVYPSVAQATSASGVVATSQLANCGDDGRSRDRADRDDHGGSRGVTVSAAGGTSQRV